MTLGYRGAQGSGPRRGEAGLCHTTEVVAVFSSFKPYYTTDMSKRLTKKTPPDDPNKAAKAVADQIAALTDEPKPGI